MTSPKTSKEIAATPVRPSPPKIAITMRKANSKPIIVGYSFVINLVLLTRKDSTKNI